MDRTSEISNVFKSNSWIYGFLSRSFYERPNEEYLAWARENVNVFYELAVNLKDFQSAENMGKYLMDLVDLEKLDLEYREIFQGPNDLLVAPWASVYLSREGIILNEHTLAVRKYYGDSGLEVLNKNLEPDDHIGLELEFLSLINKKLFEEYREGKFDDLSLSLKRERKFIEKYILSWLYKFVELMEDRTSSYYYKNLSKFTFEYIKSDLYTIDYFLSNI